MFPAKHCRIVSSSPTQEAVTQAILERYLELEKDIAEAEKGSPTMALQHKKKQIAQLDAKIVEQSSRVSKLETQT